MEYAETENIEEILQDQPEEVVEPLALELEDVGNLEQVLRGYYLSQIKNLEVRKDRKLARKLLENHLVLPKSRQRTSKDAAYIREMLGMEGILLARLEDSRLIRRLNKSGTNPIYEISHDTLVEPILAERSNREAIALFFKKYGKYFLLLLLLLFGLGMLFENKVDVLDDSLGKTQSGVVQLDAADPLYVEPGNSRAIIRVPFTEIEDYKKMDSLNLEVGLMVHANKQPLPPGFSDTLTVDLGPVDLNVSKEQLLALIEAGRDTAIPLNLMLPIGSKGISSGESGTGQLMAAVEGTSVLRIQNTRGQLPINPSPGYPPVVGPIIGPSTVQKDLGKRSVRAGETLRPVNLDTVISLAGLFPEDQVLTDLLKDKHLQLTYGVDVQPIDVREAEREMVEVEVLTSPDVIQVQTPEGPRIYKIDPAGNNARKTGYYEVKAGEGLLTVANKFNTTMQEIRDLNGMPKSQNTLTPGKQIIVPLK